MKEQLKARFFAQYIGTGAVVNFDGIEKFWGIDYAAKRVRLDSNTWWPLHHCKLVLRPLSDITDMEVLEAFNAAGIYGFDVFRDESKIGVVGRNGVSAVIWIKTSPVPIGRFLEAWNNFPDKPQPECFEFMLADYLRSKNFCLPFMGLDPVAEGWAILEPKNPGQQ